MSPSVPIAVGVPVTLRPRTGLTHAQEQIWTSQRLSPDSPLCNMTLAARIRGPLDVDRLLDAFDAVIAASDSLRTIVVESEGRPFSKVVANVAAPRAVVDIERDVVSQWIRQRVSRPLDFSARRFDSVVLRHGPADHTWMLTLHHIVTDGWSSALVFRATADAYSGRLESTPPFANYAALAASDASPRMAPTRSTAPEALYGDRGGPTTRAVRCPVEVAPLHLRLLEELLARRSFRSISRVSRTADVRRDDDCGLAPPGHGPH